MFKNIYYLKDMEKKTFVFSRDVLLDILLNIFVVFFFRTRTLDSLFTQNDLFVRSAFVYIIIKLLIDRFKLIWIESRRFRARKKFFALGFYSSICIIHSHS